MTELKIKTKGNASPTGKRKVYFCCHPDDFNKYFDKICNDIFKTHDCAIYYTENMKQNIDDLYSETGLYNMDLIIVPITFKLLTTPNRAMNKDIAYIKRCNMPILPFMMEEHIDEFYSKSENFGERQYLSPYSRDLTAIRYEDKLKKYLETTLVNDKLVKKVKAAFDAYIFLSYRKKDRKYANNLMKHIHSNPKYRDVAIWYDEFLTPGENFNKNIDKILSNSNYFILVVTKHLLEKPNYIMEIEYPKAIKRTIPIIPAQMQSFTDDENTDLKTTYKDIPNPINYDSPQFIENLSDILSQSKIKKEDTPEHSFLIGIAYLNGIDVEKNITRGVELITKAANDNSPDAMEQLYKMYFSGENVQLSLEEAHYWAEKLYMFYKNKYGDEYESTLIWLNNLVFVKMNLNDYSKAIDLSQKAYTLSCHLLGEKHQLSLCALSDTACLYGELGNHEKQLELNERAYILRCEVLGEEHPDTLISLHNVAYSYVDLGNYKKGLELNEKTYALRCKISGEEHPDTLKSLSNIAHSYGSLGDYDKQLELYKKAYNSSHKVLGEDHPDTINLLSNFARSYGDLGDFEKELRLNEKAYVLKCKVLGERHLDTISSLDNLAYSYGNLGDYNKVIELSKKAYNLRCNILGENHPDTLNLLNNMAYAYGSLGDYKKELELNEKTYNLSRTILGEEHPNTLTSLNNLAYSYAHNGNTKKAFILFNKLYIIECRIFGKSSESALKTKKLIRKLR